MKDQLLTAWQIHNSHNYLLLSELADADLQLCIGKGRSVAAQIIHLHKIRMTWLEHVGKSLYTPDLQVKNETPLDKQALEFYLNASDEKIGLLINQSWDTGGQLPAFKSGLIPFITYLIAHESHHRGLILQTLKSNGRKLPNSLKFALWEWSRGPK